MSIDWGCDLLSNEGVFVIVVGNRRHVLWVISYSQKSVEFFTRKAVSCYSLFKHWCQATLALVIVPSFDFTSDSQSLIGILWFGILGMCFLCVPCCVFLVSHYLAEIQHVLVSQRDSLVFCLRYIIWAYIILLILAIIWVIVGETFVK